MPADIANTLNLQTVSSATQVAARATSSSSPKQPVVALPGAEPARQILPTGKANTSEPGSEEVRVAVEKLNAQVQNLQRDLSFSVDESSGRTVVRVLDSETKEVVRQIPSEEVLKLAQQLDAILLEANQQVSGILVEEQA